MGHRSIANTVVPTSASATSGANEPNLGGFEMEWFVSLVIFAIVAIVVERAANSRAEGRTRKCPYCAEFVKPEAIVCKHCGRDLVSSKDTIDDFIKQARKS